MTYVSHTEHGDIWRAVYTGGGTTWKCVYMLLCPGCGQLGELDDDQWHGRISVDHASMGCPGGYHETHDFAAATEVAGWVEERHPWLHDPVA